MTPVDDQHYALGWWRASATRGEGYACSCGVLIAPTTGGPLEVAFGVTFRAVKDQWRAHQKESREKA